jgi:hypothetical protein
MKRSVKINDHEFPFSITAIDADTGELIYERIENAEKKLHEELEKYEFSNPVRLDVPEVAKNFKGTVMAYVEYTDCLLGVGASKKICNGAYDAIDLIEARFVILKEVKRQSGEAGQSIADIVSAAEG